MGHPEGRAQRRPRRRTVVFLASLVAFCLVVALVVIFRPYPSADGTVVSNSGADVTVAGARIVVPPGAAPAGSKVQASFEDRQPTGVDGTELKTLARGLKITLGDGLEPSKPLTVTMQVDKSRVISEQIEDTGKTVAMMIQSEGADHPDVVAAKWDPTAGTVTAQIPHLTTVWPFQLDLNALMKPISDSLRQIWNIESARPGCVDKPVTINGITYTAVSPAQAWLCVEQSNGSLVVTAAPNTPVPFLVSSTPTGAAGNRTDISAATVAALSLAPFLKPTQSGESLMMPGATAELTLKPPASNLLIHFKQHYVMVFVTVLFKTLERIESMVNTPIAVVHDVLDTVGKAECMQTMVQTALAPNAEEIAVGFVKSFFDCAATIAVAAFGTAAKSFAFHSFQVLLALLIDAPEAVAALVLVAANAIMQTFNIAPGMTFDAVVVASAPTVTIRPKPPVPGSEYSATLTGGATMTGPSGHLVHVSLTLPADWTAVPDPNPLNGHMKVVNGQGETRLNLGFRDDNMEGACGPTPYTLLQDDPVSIAGANPSPAGTHSGILSVTVAKGPYSAGQDYPVTLYVMLMAEAPDNPPKAGDMCLGDFFFKVGTMFGQMSQELGFNSETDAEAFLTNPNFQKLKDTMSSLNVALER
ncbi:hypothetical protein [Arthrobacter bambusae]|uniref:Uncharacterized protein n=1 Tax=Arthrobacter bambusae TaxID=1338426 RepID=A0AAW8DCQ9_9MICC|nr:hypothetical protein [Arthrobacter bambusae]MDP9905573.1 hypothetical protein [Arthrobacter bambusae]MDQ0127345.1 hypothetical protein [Arthrobacter bambusae]MDQ0178687.1 hypothetical protein [Arthrobacter bambusae]